MLEFDSVDFIYAAGAYGQKANYLDWLAGKDFAYLPDGMYFSIRDCEYLKKQGIREIRFVNSNRVGDDAFTVTL